MGKNYLNAKNSEKEAENQIRGFYISARENLKNGNLKDAYKYFKMAKNAQGCAYCLFLGGNVIKAEELLNPLKNTTPFSDFILCLCGIIRGEITVSPTFFQIRNFYEIVILTLLRYKNFDYAEKICVNIDYLSHYNMEVYKYSARIFIENGAYNDSLYFLKKSIDIVYKDPEIHFMLGEVYLKTGKKNLAIKEYKTANEVIDGYFPAQKRLKEIL